MVSATTRRTVPLALEAGDSRFLAWNNALMAISLWICGRRKEAPPTTPQEQSRSMTIHRCISQPTRNSS
jgi:hypothetical protein